MPLQNRVMPWGEILADPARGMFTGNRGCLHDDQRRLGRARWKSRAWIICELEYKGWQRQVMSPGTWTELFFLDEAVALSAGHRPCALCRRPSFNAFRHAWGGALKAPEMDGALHAARLGHRVWRDCAGLPDGAYVRIEGESLLILGAQMLPFAPAGYGPARPRAQGEVEVLTPAPTLAVLAAGYRPILHPSAG
jgi:hypothetical protein